MKTIQGAAPCWQQLLQSGKACWVLAVLTVAHVCPHLCTPWADHTLRGLLHLHTDTITVHQLKPHATLQQFVRASQVFVIGLDPAARLWQYCHSVEAALALALALALGLANATVAMVAAL